MVVRGDRGDALLAEPGGHRVVQSGARPGIEVGPVAVPHGTHRAGTDQEHVPLPDLDSLPLRAFDQVLGRDGISGRQHVHLLAPGDVKQNAPAEEVRMHLVDPVTVRAGGVDLGSGVPVVQMVLVVDMAERIPVG